METITMSKKEARYAEVISKVTSREITQARAAEDLGVSLRQVKRLCKRYKGDGVAGIVHRSRGRPSNKAVKQDEKDKILKLIIENYHDFKPQLIHEQLLESHNIKKSSEWIRLLMIQKGLWKPHIRKNIPVHQRRNRRSRYGELVQFDGSYHAWFEDRGPKCCLLVGIDDATSALTNLLFVNHETTEGYMKIFKEYLQKFGKPLAIYTDKLNAVKSTSSQVKRALGEVGVELINANSPQAKGRVERANSTLQDRLIKMMRLKGINSIEEGNKYLEEYRLDHNSRFARKPSNPNNGHLTVSENTDLDKIFCVKEERIVSKSHSVKYNNKEYLLDNGVGLRGKKASVYEIEGKIYIDINGKSYSYKIYEEQPYMEVSLSRKQLDAHLDKKKYMSAIGRHRKGIRSPR